MPARVAQPPSSDAWLHEIKRDGYRMTAVIRDGAVRLISRHDLDWSVRLPAIFTDIGELGLRDAQLDGELIAVDQDGRDDFELLQRTLGPGPASPLAYVAFDVMRLDGFDLTRSPLLARRTLLAEIVAGSRVAYSSHQIGRGPEVFALAAEAGAEGIVSKRIDSAYPSGTTRLWVKCVARREATFVAIGWMAPAGNSPGGLMLAHEVDGVFVYVGRVGSGLSEERVRELRANMRATRRAPFELGAYFERRLSRIEWAEPTVRVMVAFRAITSDGFLRHPSVRAIVE